MDEAKTLTPISMGTKTKSWEKREKFEDGSYNEVRVREVSNGFIKTVTKHYKEDDDWKYEIVESIHTDNPMEEKSLADKLHSVLKGY